MEAVAMMPSHDDVRLLLLGGDGATAASTLKLQTLAGQLGIAGKVIIPGRIEHADLATYYNAADVVAIPSYYESFGLVVLESLACGTPVVATPVGVVESVVKTGRNGIVVRNQTPAGIAQALAQVLKWAAQGRIRPHEVRQSVMHFNWPVVASAVSDQYACAADTLRLEKRPDSRSRCLNPRFEKDDPT
jgi:D-inositol-3-phosphate glycosyltransferase